MTRILNPSEVSGEIAFFGEQTGNFRECHTFQELSAVAQEAGAVGAIIPYYDEPGRIPPWADPQILPFDFQIDTYIVLAASGDMITPYIDGDHTPEVVNEEVTLRLPPSDGRTSQKSLRTSCATPSTFSRRWRRLDVRKQTSFWMMR